MFEEMLKNPDLISTLTRENIVELLKEAGRILRQEPNLIELPRSGRTIFVGDTHGDFDATKKVIASYLRDSNKVIFLGDYVDRGAQSMENINYLALLKLNYPEDIFLLMGNHEAYDIINFCPADFWSSLDPELYTCYAEMFSQLPLVVSASNGVLALHGSLPDVASLEEINKISLGSREWHQITWGDFQNTSGGLLGEYVGRPQFGEDYFADIMSRFGKNLLIRSHQPMTPLLYDKRCLTIFTSHAYFPARTIAILDLEKEAKTSDDITIATI
jgi:predicted phosphodiesterase